MKSENVSSARSPSKRSVDVPLRCAGWRADRAFAAITPEMNRRTAKVLFRSRHVRLNGRLATGSERVETGDRFEFTVPSDSNATHTEPRLTTPHGRHLLRLYEDAELLVISKPAEIPVHRGQGGYLRRDTLEDVLRRAYPATTEQQEGFYFVHRLDMETSGCLLIAKSDRMRDELIKMFSERQMQKEYLAIVAGTVPWNALDVAKRIAYVKAEDVIHQRRRRGSKPVVQGLKKGIVLPEDAEDGKEAFTHFEVAERFNGYTLIRAFPKTGRTHQIRVHLAGTGYPLGYDPLYGRQSPIRFQEFSVRATGSDQGEAVVLNRLPLHAHRISFKRPFTGEKMEFEAPMPRDLKEFLRLLTKYRQL